MQGVTTIEVDCRENHLACLVAACGFRDEASL